ncbi:MAG: ferritin-like domain-containing protein [Rickettsiales bacterium]
MNNSEFMLDIEKIRQNAKRKIEDGPVTQGYNIDTDSVISMLNDALATEIICTLRYRQHHAMCEGQNTQHIADEFLEHAEQEQQHADQITERITQLGGEPDMDPANISKRAHSDYKPAGSIEQMIKENLFAERVAIDSYKAMIQYLGDNDPTTRRMLEEILAVEEEHADDLAGLLHKH